MNLSALNNITPLSINNSLINDTSTSGTALISNANELTGGYFGLGIMISTFILLMLILMSQQDVFRLNFVSSLALSSGMCLIIGIIGIVSTVFINYQHIMWFAIIFAFSLMFKYYER